MEIVGYGHVEFAAGSNIIRGFYTISRMNKSTIAIVAALSLLCGIALSWTIQRNQLPELESLRWLGDQARPLPAIELFDHRGGIVTRESFKDQWSLIFFGYTYCPDICASSMLTMSQVLNAVGQQSEASFRVYFISVDPVRDTPQQMATYVNYFNDKITGATNTETKLRELTGFLGILHKSHQASEEDLDYLVDHSGHYILINPEAQFTGLFSAPHDASAIARDLTRIIDHY